jgi:rubredoxin
LIGARTINRLLSVFDVAVTRRTTLDRLVAEGHGLRERLNAGAPPESEDKLPASINALRIELLRHQIALKWSLIDAAEPDGGADRAASPSTRRCPLCGYETAREHFAVYRSQCIFGGGRLLRFQCPRCDLIFGPDKMLRLSEEELTQEYEWHYRVYSEGDSSAQEMRAFFSLDPSRSGVYLNYGAGAWSKTMKLLRDEGWQVYAFEPHGSAHSGSPEVIASKDKLSAMKFDGLFSNNLLEHLRDPVGELRFMAGLLKPGAAMAHATPCFRYAYEYTRFHLFFYPGRSRRVLMDEAGLSMVDFIEDGEFMNVVCRPRHNV